MDKDQEIDEIKLRIKTLEEKDKKHEENIKALQDYIIKLEEKIKRLEKEKDILEDKRGPRKSEDHFLRSINVGARSSIIDVSVPNVDDLPEDNQDLEKENFRKPEKKANLDTQKAAKLLLEKAVELNRKPFQGHTNIYWVPVFRINEEEHLLLENEIKKERAKVQFFVESKPFILFHYENGVLKLKEKRKNSYKYTNATGYDFRGREIEFNIQTSLERSEINPNN